MTAIQSDQIVRKGVPVVQWLNSSTASFSACYHVHVPNSALIWVDAARLNCGLQPCKGDFVFGAKYNNDCPDH